MSEQQICTDLAAPPLEWDKPFRAHAGSAQNVTVSTDPYAACAGSHAIAVMTEWEDCKGYNWAKVYSSMVKPAFLFDGRSLLNPVLSVSMSTAQRKTGACQYCSWQMTVWFQAACMQFGSVACC